MKDLESLPHRTIRGLEQDDNIRLLKRLPQRAWIHAFVPVPRVAGMGLGGIQGRLVGRAGSLRVRPPPS